MSALFSRLFSRVLSRALIVSLLLGVAFLSLLCVAEARPVRWWTPAELCERSDVVVLASPTSVRRTKRRGQIQLPGNAPLPVVTYEATLSVKHAIKGEELKQIEFHYSALDTKRVKAVANGPSRLHLTKGSVYVLYLRKKKGSSVFENALEGKFDDGQAAVLVAPPPGR